MLAASLGGCSTLGWYGQAIGGHLELLAARRDIDRVLADPATPEPLRHQLRGVDLVREFATSRLRLPGADSYTQYADLGRRAAVWNVIAAPRHSLQPRTWRYLLVGRLSYRGYFDRRVAYTYARKLAADDWDVTVVPAIAYSTLGWFDDPVLNTMLTYPPAQLAELLFHELAHRRLYVPGATRFNESYASFVGARGVEIWLREHGEQGAPARWRRRLADRDTVAGLIAATRQRLRRIYRLPLSPAQKTIARQQAFLELRADYLQLLRRRPGLAAWRDWFAQPLNNAVFAHQADYNAGRHAFERLWACNGGDWSGFHSASERIGAWPQQRRQRWLGLRIDTPRELCQLSPP